MNTRPRIHIVIISSGLNVAGGLEKMVIALANALQERNYAISLLILGSDKNRFFPINDNINIDNIEADFGIGGTATYLQRKIRFFKDVSLLRKKMIALQPNIVITTEYPQTVALIFGRLHKKYKIIAWQHSSYYQLKSRIWKKSADYAYKKVQAIVCLTEEENNIFCRFNRHAIVIENFITECDKPQADLNNNVILTVARLAHNKGIDLLMQCAILVLKKYKNWCWKIIGTGEQKDSLLSFISQQDLSNQLQYAEPVSYNMENEYSTASIYVMTSRVEPFGMVLIEAMSYGLPCIAFDCETGPRHIITKNMDGILVEKENPGKMAEAIAILIEDKEKRSQMGKAAFESSKQFSSTIILKKWEELFNKLLAS